jgi:hypothetical protein
MSSFGDGAAVLRAQKIFQSTFIENGRREIRGKPVLLGFGRL